MKTFNYSSIKNQKWDSRVPPKVLFNFRGLSIFLMLFFDIFIMTFTIYKIQMPNITPHVCHYTYCSNQAKARMNPKTLQYLMGHSEIAVTMAVYTYLGLADVKNEIVRLEELEYARKEVNKIEHNTMLNLSKFKAL